ncbi:hypothetical protein [Legionella feeleii]|nr:hypothetical protein [Legionella feeleii]
MMKIDNQSFGGAAPRGSGGEWPNHKTKVRSGLDKPARSKG